MIFHRKIISIVYQYFIVYNIPSYFNKYYFIQMNAFVKKKLKQINYGNILYNIIVTIVDLF